MTHASSIRSFTIALLLLVSAQALAQDSEPEALGSRQRLAFAFRGTIYALPEGTWQLPDFSTLKPMGTIFTPRLNVPPMSFDQGFPGVTDSVEWFAIDYHADFKIEKEELYRFELLSDDGSRLYIDGQLVIDNDGTHAPEAVRGTILLSRGVHKMRVQYFQGPRFEIALVLRYGIGEINEEATEEENWSVFDPGTFGTVETERLEGKTRYTLGASALFDLDKAILKPEADTALLEIVSAFKEAPATAVMLIDGHTDDLGSDAHNRDLSNRRAEAVAVWMTAHGISRSRLVVKGYGEGSPRYPNTSEENRARNRRVEITVEDRTPGTGTTRQRDR